MKLKTLAAFLILAVSRAAARDAEAGRFIQANVMDVKGPRSMVWQDCVGAGRVREGFATAGGGSLTRAGRTSGGYQVLFWDLTRPPFGQGMSDHQFFWKPHPPKEKGHVAIQRATMPAGKYKLTTHQIGYQRNDPLSRWLELDSPANLSREQTAEFKALSSNKPVGESDVTVGGEFSTTLPMLENSVYLPTLTPESIAP